MTNFELKTDPRVESVFKNYPTEIKNKILHLRTLILEVASEISTIHELEETLKWGEPSYITKKGSTLRIDWKKKTPNQYAMYFKCTSKLVATFKVVYKNTFSFEGTRAIVFKLNEEIPEATLKKCIAVALTYHSVKNSPLLGMQ